MIRRLFVPLYNCFGTFGFVLLGLSFLPNKHTVDIHLHDTYYIIGADLIFIFLGCFSLLIWMIYQLFKKRQYSSLLTNLHTVVTFGCVIFLFCYANSGTPRRYMDFSAYRFLDSAVSLTMLTFLSAQLLFLFNIIAGLLKR